MKKIPTKAPNKIPKLEKIVDIPNADTKKETYMGFLVNLNIPVVMIFFVSIKGAGDSSFR